MLALRNRVQKQLLYSRHLEAEFLLTREAGMQRLEPKEGERVRQFLDNNVIKLNSIKLWGKQAAYIRRGSEATRRCFAIDVF